MIIIGLLVIALVCLALGLALASGVWLIASLIASVGAGLLLWKVRAQLAPARPSVDADAPDRPVSAGSVSAGSGPAASVPAGSVPAGPVSAGSGLAGSAPAAQSLAPSSVEIDGAAASLAPLSAPPAIPAVTEPAPSDGRAVLAPSAAVPAQVGRQVWVVDGRPRYHLADCAIIEDEDAEMIPATQAVEDGFIPCSLCEPNVVRAPAE